MVNELAVGSGSGSISAFTAVMIFVGIPLLVFIAIIIAVSLPSIIGGPRYRPGLSWWAEPVWFGGPNVARVAQAATDPEKLGEFVTVPFETGGGASARW